VHFPLDSFAVQGGVAPLVVGLILAAALVRARLSGLAVVGGFLTAAYLTGSLGFWPLTAVRKALLLGVLAPAAGLLLDFAITPRRHTGALLGGLFGLASVWVFWGVLAQRPAAEAIALGGGIVFFVVWTVATTLPLQAEPLRTGAIGLALGLGTGVGAILGASASLGLLGIALAAGVGGFMLVAVMRGNRVFGGATLALSVSVIPALVGAAALVLAKLPWWSLAIFAMVPLAARLPVPDRASGWIQGMVVSLYALAVAAAGSFLGWRFSA
jgi:hypothetical protein